MYSNRMKLCGFALIVAFTMLIVYTKPTSGRPNVDEMVDMAEALRYLEKLDKYYSQIARPR
ncbi:hypothetical protein B4U79_10376, partial [Dinothrombium tinctorium]